MLVVPVAFVCGLTYIGLRNTVCGRNRVGSLDGSATQTVNQRPTSSDGNVLLNKMFVLVFCVYPFLAVRLISSLYLPDPNLRDMVSPCRHEFVTCSRA
jgi:hypothetical protein